MARDTTSELDEDKRAEYLKEYTDYQNYRIKAKEIAKKYWQIEVIRYGGTRAYINTKKGQNGIDGTNGEPGKTGFRAVFSGNPNGLKA